MLAHLRKGYKIINIELLQYVMGKPIIKFCNGRNNYIDKNICDCLNTCNMNTDKKQKQITYHTTQICVFTQKYQNIDDCICIHKCSGAQNELQLYFSLEK